MHKITYSQEKSYFNNDFLYSIIYYISINNIYNIKGVRSYHVPNEVRPPSMDEVLVPQGSWQQSYSKAQQKYNLQLAAGIIILGATIAYVCIYQIDYCFKFC